MLSSRVSSLVLLLCSPDVRRGHAGMGRGAQAGLRYLGSLL